MKRGQGIVRITWNKDNEESVSSAKESFLKYYELGWLAFTTLPNGKNMHIISFDPSLEEITIVMPLEGGTCLI